jgi:hypothetical protein
MVDLWPCKDALELLKSNGPILPCPNYDVTFVIYFMVLVSIIALGLIAYFELRARFSNLAYNIEWAIRLLQKYIKDFDPCVNSPTVDGRLKNVKV